MWSSTIVLDPRQTGEIKTSSKERSKYVHAQNTHYTLWKSFSKIENREYKNISTSGKRVNFLEFSTICWELWIIKTKINSHLIGFKFIFATGFYTNFLQRTNTKRKNSSHIKIEESRNKYIENVYVHAIKQVHIRSRGGKKKVNS